MENVVEINKNRSKGRTGSSSLPDHVTRRWEVLCLGLTRKENIYPFLKERMGPIEHTVVPTILSEICQDPSLEHLLGEEAFLHLNEYAPNDKELHEICMKTLEHFMSWLAALGTPDKNAKSFNIKYTQIVANMQDELMSIFESSQVFRAVISLAKNWLETQESISRKLFLSFKSVAYRAFYIQLKRGTQKRDYKLPENFIGIVHLSEEDCASVAYIAGWMLSKGIGKVYKFRKTRLRRESREQGKKESLSILEEEEGGNNSNNNSSQYCSSDSGSISSSDEEEDKEERMHPPSFVENSKKDQYIANIIFSLRVLKEERNEEYYGLVNCKKMEAENKGKLRYPNSAFFNFTIILEKAWKYLLLEDESILPFDDDCEIINSVNDVILNNESIYQLFLDTCVPIGLSDGPPTWELWRRKCYEAIVEDYKNVRGRDHENLIRRVMTDLHIKEGGSFRQNLLNTAAAIKSKEPSNSAMIIDED